MYRFAPKSFIFGTIAILMFIALWFALVGCTSLYRFWGWSGSGLGSQVLTTFFEDLPEGSGSALQQERQESLLAQMAEALRCDDRAGESERRKRKTDMVKVAFKKGLLSNKYFALSLDKSLRMSLGFGLDRFEPTAKNFTIGKGEELVLVDAPAEELGSFSCPRRAAARLKSTGSTQPHVDRVLVPRSLREGRFLRPTLHKAQDQGAIGWPCSMWLDNCLQLRGTTIEDPSHRFYGNDFKDAFVTAGVWIHVCERSVLYNASTAPWQGHGYHSLLAECAETYFASRDWRCPCFALLYPSICDELRLPMLERGTPEHMQHVFGMVQSLKTFTNKGDRVKLGRWASWFRATVSWRGKKMLTLLVLLFMGITKGWWKSLAELPLLCVLENELAAELAEPSEQPGAQSSPSSSSASGLRPQPVPADGDAGQLDEAHPAAPVDKKYVAASNEEVKQVRLGSKHHLQFCANLLANHFGNSLAEQTQRLAQPLCQWLDMMKTQCASPQGTADWHVDLVSGSLDEVISDTWAMLADPQELNEIGYLSKLDFEYYTEAELEQDVKLAEIMFDTMAAVSQQFLMSGMTWTSRYPGRFVGLLAKDGAARQQHADHIKHDFQLLLDLQKLSHDEVWAQAFIGDLQWPSQTFVMELFYMLYEVGFKELTPEVHSSLQGFAQSWASSLVNEDGFKLLREVSDGSLSGQMQRATRWGNLAASDLMAKHGRKSVTISSAARAACKKPPVKETFVAKNALEFSMGVDTLETINSSGWAHPGAAGNKMVGCAWACWRFCHGDISAASRAWLSLLVSPGCLLRNGDLGVRGVCVGTTQWGLFILPIDIEKAGHITYCRIQRKAKPTFVCVTAMEGWKALKPQVWSPAFLAKAAGSGQVHPGIVLECARSSSVSLGVYAAREGFKMMTKQYLDKLMRAEKLRFPSGRQPKTVEDVATALIKHFMPKASEKFVEDSLAHRGLKRNDGQLAQQCVLALGSNLEAMCNCMDADDHEVLKAAVTDAKAKMAANSCKVVSKSGASSWVRKPVDPKLACTLKTGRDLLPPVKGCALSLDEIRFTRWTATYPTPTPPHYVSKSYGPQTGFTSKQAFFYVIETVWKWHSELTGEVCPHQWPTMGDGENVFS